MGLVVLWPEERTARLRELHAQGYSGGKISVIMTAEFGMDISRNAVRGKVHRLKLPPVCKPRWMTSSRRSRKRAPSPITVWHEPTGPKISLRDSNGNHCRFIADNPNGFDTLFCSAPAVYRSYCVYHTRICYETRTGAPFTPRVPSGAAADPRPPACAAAPSIPAQAAE